MTKPRLGSCLSGVGGIDLGFHYAEWEIAWQVERDPYKLAVLARMWPEVPHYQDLFALKGSELPQADCIVIDCPLHRYRDDMALLASALQLAEVWLPEFFIVCLPCAVQFRDEGADWEPLLAALAAHGYQASSFQTSVGHGTFWWERTWLIGHRHPLGSGLAQCIGLRQLFYDAVDHKERDRLCHGRLDYGDLGGAECDLAFPKLWTCICDGRFSSVPCTSEARDMALRQATCVDVSAWLAKLLLEELKILAGEVVDAAK